MPRILLSTNDYWRRPKTESDNQTTNGGQDRIQLRNDAASVPTVHGTLQFLGSKAEQNPTLIISVFLRL